MSCTANGDDTFFSTETLIVQWTCTNAALYAVILVLYFVVNLGQQWVWARQLQLKREAQKQPPRDRAILPLVMWQILSTTLSSITILLLVSKNFGVIITGIAGHAAGVALVYSRQEQDHRPTLERHPNVYHVT